MKQSELKHELAVNRNSWFIRFYVWLWEANPADINFCKIFWGYVFVIPGLLVRLVLVPIVNRIEKRTKASEEARRERLAQLKTEGERPKERTGPSRMQRMLSSIANAFSRIVLFLGSIVHFISKRAPLMKILYAGALCLGAAASGLLVWLIVANFSAAWPVLAAIVGVILVGLVTALLVETGAFDWIAYKIFRRLGLKAKGGALGFFSVLRIGFRSVKTNTCPRIVLK